MTKEKQFSFLSKDGKTKIHAVKWMPESGEYRAVLQITHGMVEYIERYKPFAEFLNDQGSLWSDMIIWDMVRRLHPRRNWDILQSRIRVTRSSRICTRCARRSRQRTPACRIL